MENKGTPPVSQKIMSNRLIQSQCCTGNVYFRTLELNLVGFWVNKVNINTRPFHILIWSSIKVDWQALQHLKVFRAKKPFLTEIKFTINWFLINSSEKLCTASSRFSVDLGEKHLPIVQKCFTNCCSILLQIRIRYFFPTVTFSFIHFSIVLFFLYQVGVLSTVLIVSSSNGKCCHSLLPFSLLLPSPETNESPQNMK